MAVKSVIDIDVNDAKFKRFSDTFNKYQAALAKQPDMWKKSDKEVGHFGSTFAAITAALFAQNELHKEGQETLDKSNKNLANHASLWNTIHKSTTGVLKDVGSIAKWLTKMGIDLGLGAIGTGIAGLFGLLAMAKSVSSERNKSLGLDTSIGQTKAFEKFQGRMLDNPDEVLKQAMQAQYAASPAGILATQLHISTAGGTYAVANRELLAVQKYFKGKSDAQIAMLSQAMPAFAAAGFGLSDIIRLEHLPPGELPGLLTQGNAAVSELNKPDKLAKRWQDALSQLDTTFTSIITKIENTIANSNLLPAVEKFMGAIGKDIQLLVSSGTAAKGLDALSNGIERFAKFITSPDFVKELDKIASAAGFVAHPIQSAVGGVLTKDAQGNWHSNEFIVQQNIQRDIANENNLIQSHKRLRPTNIPMAHIHIDPLPLIKIHVTKIPGGDAVQVIQNLHGGAG